MVKKTGLGKGLDALIPIISEEDLKNDISLEDILNKNNENKDQRKLNKDFPKENKNKNYNMTDEKIKNDENIKDVLKVIEKNPRITLWSSKSAAVLRYLRKTRPEFSISKEASMLMDEAISNKYPEIWKLFESLN